MSLRCQSRIQIIGVSLHGLQVDGNELFGGLSHEPVRNTDAMISWGCMNASGASPTVFSVIEKIVSGAQKIGSASEKSVWVTPTIVWTRKNIVLDRPDQCLDGGENGRQDLDICLRS